MKDKKSKFLEYNKRNMLENLLQAEEHSRAINTLKFMEGEFSCFFKHILFVHGEVKEAMAHTTNPKEFKIFEKIEREIRSFLEEIETGKKEYTKKQLIDLVRKWRKEIEKTIPVYQTFKCKCLHFIPYLKIAIIFLGGSLFNFILWSILKVVG